MDQARACKFFHPGSDQGYLLVTYEDLTDEEESEDSALVLWRANEPPCALQCNEQHRVEDPFRDMTFVSLMPRAVRRVVPTYTVSPSWAEQGIEVALNVEDDQLACLGPLGPTSHSRFRHRSRNTPHPSQPAL